MNEKPRLLVFSDWFAPGFKAGGPISSVINFVYLMKANYDVHVFTSDTDHGEVMPYQSVIPNQWTSYENEGFTIFYAKKATLSLKQIKQQIEVIQPDFVYLNNMFSPYFVLYPVYLKWRGWLKAKTVITPRGTLYASALAVKPLKKKVFISLFRLLGFYKPLIFQATSVREAAAIEKFFPGSNMRLADDLPSVLQPVFQSVEKSVGKIKCIFVSRIVDIKNLFFLLERLISVKQELTLTIIGPVEDGAYWQLCQKQIKQLPSNIQVDYLGAQPPAALPAFIRQHHLYILPTKGENFGHGIFEALLLGRPVLISDQTPWSNLEQEEAGWALSLSDGAAYTNIIDEVAGWQQDLFDKRALAAWNYANKYLENARFRHQYFSLFS